MIAMWPHIMHNHILDFQLYSQHDELLEIIHFTTFFFSFFLQLWTVPSVLHSWIFCLRTTRVGAMQSLEGTDWSWEIADDKDSFNKWKSTTRNSLLLTKEVRGLWGKYYKNNFPFYILIIFPYLSMILFNTKTTHSHQWKGSKGKVSFFPITIKKNWLGDTFRRGIVFLPATGPSFLTPWPMSWLPRSAIPPHASFGTLPSFPWASLTS